MYRKVQLNGRSSSHFIQDDVAYWKEWHQDMVSRGIYKTGLSDHNLAELLCSRISMDVITEEEMEQALPLLGFSPEGTRRFLDETIGQSQKLTELKNNIQGQPLISGIRTWTSPENPQ